jgi:serine/threonine protein phosphatase 1
MQKMRPTAGDPVFNPTIESYHTRVDADAYGDIYVIGDVHGCMGELERLVGWIGPDEETLLVFLGDLVRKGPESSAVLDYVRDHENALSVRGNNEQKLIDGRSECDGLTDRDIEYLQSLPVAVSWDEALAVHGGIDPRMPLVEHTMEDLLTMRRVAPETRRPYWFDRHRGSPRVFFGHTVLREPFETPWSVGLDTGCVYGGQLTAYHYNSGEILSLDVEQAYQSREADDFLAPRATYG